MPIEIRCGSCQRLFRVKDGLGGKRVKCLGCGEPVAVPTAEAEAVEPGPTTAIPWEYPASGAWPVRWARTWAASLFRPAALFAGVPASEAHVAPILFIVATCGIMALAMLVVMPLAFALGLMTIPGMPKDQVAAVGAIGAAIGVVCVTPVLMGVMILGSYVSAGILHLAMKAVGGKGSYTSTFRAVSYSASTSLFSLVPFVGVYVGIAWQVVCLVFGLAAAHGTGRGRSGAVAGALGALGLAAMIVLQVAASRLQPRMPHPAPAPGVTAEEHRGDLAQMRQAFDDAMKSINAKRAAGQAPGGREILVAERLCRTMEKLEPKLGEPAWRMARLHAAIENHQEALAFAKKAAGKEPSPEASLEGLLAIRRLHIAGQNLHHRLPDGDGTWILWDVPPPLRLDSWTLDLEHGSLPRSNEFGLDEPFRSVASSARAEDGALLHALGGSSSARRELESLQSERVEVLELLAMYHASGPLPNAPAGRALAINPRSLLALAARAGTSLHELRAFEQEPARVVERLEMAIPDIEELVKRLPSRPDLVLARGKACNLLARARHAAGLPIGEAGAAAHSAWDDLIGQAGRQPIWLYHRGVSSAIQGRAEEEAGRDPSMRYRMAIADFMDVQKLNAKSRYARAAVADVGLRLALWRTKRGEDATADLQAAVAMYDALEGYPGRVPAARVLALVTWASNLQKRGASLKDPAAKLLKYAEPTEVDALLKGGDVILAYGDELKRAKDATARDVIGTARRWFLRAGESDAKRRDEARARVASCDAKLKE